MEKLSIQVIRIFPYILEALNDVWLYNISSKNWTELKASNSFIFESRFCHSCSVFGEKLFVFGGMKNSDDTLDTLSILSLDGKNDEFEENKLLEIGQQIPGNYYYFYY